MDDNIEVAIRVRPLLHEELEKEVPVYWQIDNQNIFQIDEHGKRSLRGFRFDHIFGGDKTNGEIFQTVVQPMIRSAMKGYNATVFAYGQTASGKTHTMLGSDSHRGIIPLTIEDIFKSINNNPERKFLLRLSYIEIYNDIIYDLLDTTTKTIKIHNDSTGAICLNVEEKIIHVAEEAYVALKQGEELRKYGATNANQRSSRSHTIFRIIIESTARNENPDAELPVQVSHLNLVDLAGSERASQSMATGARLREGGQINKSLHVLSMVIRQLSEGKDFTNFRDSKLTRILKDSLGGNAKTLIIGAITPTSIEDSHSTLTFTYQAKKIKNKPTINEVLDSDTLTRKYIQKEKKLQKQLAEMAKDKKDLEDKHIRTVNELTDELYYYRQQFIISTHDIPKKEVENRRHTIGPSMMQKKLTHLNFSKCATVQRNTKLRKHLPLQSISENTQKITVPLVSNEEPKSLEETDKYQQPPISLKQENCSHNDENVAPRTITQKLVCESSPMGEEESERLSCTPHKTITPTEITEIKKPTGCDQDQLKKLLEANELLKKNMDEINNQLEESKQANALLKLQYEEITKILEKTEDDLLSANEQLDHEENEKNQLTQAIAKINQNMNELKDVHGVLQLKKMWIDILKSNENLIKYLKGKEEPKPKEDSEEEQNNAESEAVQSYETPLESMPQDINSITSLLNNVKMLLCFDCKEFILTNEQEQMVNNLLDRRNHEDNTEGLEERNGDLQEEIIFNSKNKLNSSKLEEQNCELVQILNEVEFHYNQPTEMIQQLSAETNALMAKLTEQQQINQKLIEGNTILQNSLTRLEEENSNFSAETNDLKNKIIDQAELITELTNKNHLLENGMATNLKLIEENKTLGEMFVLLTEEKQTLEQSNTKLLDENNALNQKLLQQDRLIAEQNQKYIDSKITEEKGVLRDKVLNKNTNDDHLQQQKINMELMRQQKILTDQVQNREKEINNLLEENNSLRERLTEMEISYTNLITNQHSLEEVINNQKCINTKLVKENKALQENLILCQQVNKNITDEKLSLENMNTKLTEENNIHLTQLKGLPEKPAEELIDSTEENALLLNHLAEHNPLFNKSTKENDVFAHKLSIEELTDKITALETQLATKDLILSQFRDIIREIEPITKTSQENKVLRDENSQQQKTINELTQQVNLHYKQMKELKILIEKHKTLVVTPMKKCEQNVCDNLNVFKRYSDRTSSVLNSYEGKVEWDILVKQLRDIMETKDKKIVLFDKQIVESVNYIKSLEKSLSEQAKQISKFKEQEITKLKTREISMTELKKRRSITQDSSRNLEEIGQEPCCSCRDINLIGLNHELLRKTNKIAELENVVHNLSSNYNEANYKQLNSKFETLQSKYQQMKKVAMMRGEYIKSIKALKVDCETQT